MVIKFAAMSLAALVAVAPLAAVAQTEQLAQAAPAAAPAAAPSGTHKSQMRHRSNRSKVHTRAGAHHMHKMRTAPAEAPKS
jgi:hypothetical protein